MAWAKVGNDFEPDGAFFEDPIDTFERKYNAERARGIVDNDEISLENGWPLSSRTMERRPTGKEETRNLLDWYFSWRTQEMASENGNTPEELDKLAREALLWAACFEVPITDAERNVARRLGVQVDHLAPLPDTRLRHHRLGF